ncbi:ABC transporter ATP-binding protein [Pseudonocardia sp. NPDC049635]|uniref:ABC transporter ATP-binding protein n=1 Tax=Pseudonocardia sp. NPDC049635 TaxID=3155506 RepID=UPI0033FD8B09
MTSDAHVQVRGLSVSYRVGGRQVTAVNDLDIEFCRGAVTAVVGESGSGKSTVARAIAGILPSNARVDAGEVLLGGQDLLRLSERQLRTIRGSRVGFVPQDPTASLNPTQRIGAQVAEAVVLHLPMRGAALRDRVGELLAGAGLTDVKRISRSFPHELSGGMRQRVLIAIALAGGAELVIADEPTSALDVTVAARVLDQLTKMVTSAGTTLVIITHDLSLATHRADRVAVLHRGAAVEAGPAAEVMARPRHEYTSQLLASTPGLRDRRQDRVRPDTSAVDGALVRLEGVSKSFGGSRYGRAAVAALSDVSLRLLPGRTFALIGESGSGKSTTARIVLGLERADSGTVELFGHDLADVGRHAMRELRRRVQVVYQSPFASLDPRFSVGRSIREPLVAHRAGTRAEQLARVDELLNLVRLPSSYARRRPAELSGGQCQRVAIARALALSPELVVCDEPVSALDASVQAQVLDLLREIQERSGVAYLFISHDLAVVRDIAHDVAVMQNGRIVESGGIDDIFERPTQPFTRLLLEASLRHAGGTVEATIGSEG